MPEIARYRGTIPNQHGYSVRLLLMSGEWRDDRVVRGDDGLHRLELTPIAEVRGWLPRYEVSRA